MTTTTKTCLAAVASVKRLRDLARSTGYPPTADAELVRLVQAVEPAADAVRAHAVETISAESDRDQPGLFRERGGAIGIARAVKECVPRGR